MDCYIKAELANNCLPKKFLCFLFASKLIHLPEQPVSIKANVCHNVNLFEFVMIMVHILQISYVLLLTNAFSHIFFKRICTCSLYYIDSALKTGAKREIKRTRCHRKHLSTHLKNELTRQSGPVFIKHLSKNVKECGFSFSLFNK